MECKRGGGVGNFTPLIFVCFRVDLLVSSFYFSCMLFYFIPFNARKKPHTIVQIPTISLK